MKDNSRSEERSYTDASVSGSLKTQAIRSSIVSFVSRILTTLMQMIGVIVLARLLTPDDFGLFAMASVFISIFFVFQDVGLTDATIQASTLNQNIVSSLFWINFGIGLAITALLCLISPLAVNFFRKPELSSILIVSSLQFIFWGLSFQHVALLKRQLLFLKTAIISVLAAAVSTTIGIILALTGCRYWALVLRDLAWAISTFALAWLFCRWRPGKPAHSQEVKNLMKFGLNSVGFYIINYFSNNLDKIIIGKKFDSEQLGYYSRSYYLATTPSGQLSQSLFHVAISTLSKLRNNPAKFKSYYYDALSLISFVGMPMSLLLTTFSREIVLLILGPKWTFSVKLLSILGVSMGFNIIYNTNGWLHVSLGRSDRWLKWGILSSFLLIIGLIAGTFFGLTGIAWAYSLLIIILTFPSLLYAGQLISISLKSIFKAVLKNTLAAYLSGVLVWQIKVVFLSKLMLFLRLLAGVLIYGLIYLLLLIIISRGLSPLKEYLRQVKSGLKLD